MWELALCYYWIKQKQNIFLTYSVSLSNVTLHGQLFVWKSNKANLCVWDRERAFRYSIQTLCRLLQWILCIAHEHLSGTTNSSSFSAPPILHTSLALSCTHSLPLTLIDTEKHTDEVKWSEKGWEDEMKKIIAPVWVWTLTNCFGKKKENHSVPTWTANSKYLVISNLDIAHSSLCSLWQWHGFDSPQKLFKQIYTHKETTFTLLKASLKQSTQFTVVYNIFFSISIKYCKCG